MLKSIKDKYMYNKTKLNIQDHLDGAATLVLRLGLSWFIFLWAAHKLITPKQYQNLARHFDGVDVSLAQVYTIGSLQILLCILVALGIARYFPTAAYWSCIPSPSPAVGKVF